MICEQIRPPPRPIGILKTHFGRCKHIGWKIQIDEVSLFTYGLAELVLIQSFIGSVR
jgi:hypothetical protein